MMLVPLLQEPGGYLQESYSWDGGVFMGNRVYESIPPKGLNLYCCVCGHITHDQYMICDSTWKLAGFARTDNAHIACVHKKLGRQLAIRDFTDSQINNAVRFGYMLGIRDGKIIGRGER